MIREATLEDVPRLVEMGLRFLTTTRYRTAITGDPAAMAAITQRLILHPQGAIFVAEQAGSLVGMIGLFLIEHPISGELTASEMFWWVEPEQRGIGVRLYRRAEAWAKAAGAAVIQMIAPTDEVARFYQRIGFTFVEATYQRRV